MRLPVRLWFVAMMMLTLSGGAAEDAYSLRTWTSVSGTKVQATLLSLDDDAVILKTPTGEQIQIRADKLSPDDRQLVHALSNSSNTETRAISEDSVEAPPSWFTSYDEAKAQAKKDKKRLFILFTDSERCKPCRDLHSNVLTSETFLAYAKEKLVLFEADMALERKDEKGILAAQTEKLMKKYPHQGTPWVFIARSTGATLGSTPGYMGESPEQYIKERLKKYVM
jgi:thioredoxin-related protein